MGKLAGKKTYVTGVLGIITAVAAMATGDLTSFQGAEAILNCLFAVFIRHGVASA